MNSRRESINVRRIEHETNTFKTIKTAHQNPFQTFKTKC